MKNICIYLQLFIFLGIANVSYAQFFGFLQTNPRQYYNVLLREPNDGKYRVTNLKYPAVGGSFRSQILIFNQTLQVVDSVNYLNGINLASTQPLKFGNKYLWPATLIDTVNNNPQSQKLVILELDSDYKHITCHSITNYENNFLYTSNIVFEAGRFYVAKSINVISAPTTFYKLNSQFSIESSSTYSTAVFVSEIYNMEGKLFLKGRNFPTPCSTDPSGCKVMLDTNFNILSCYDASNFGIHSPTGKLLPISKTKFIAIGDNYFGTTNPHLGIVNTIFDNSNQIIASKNYSYTGQHACYSDFYNFAAIELGKIFTVASIGQNISGLPPQPQKTKIFVNKIDSVGNLIWQKEYGNDMYYRPQSIVCTNDGGCLIAGLRYDTAGHRMPGIMESFLLKLDANGEYLNVNIFENGKINLKVNCFPNPANDKLFFDIPFQDNISIAIYSALGNEVLKIVNYPNLSAVDISIFSNGIYFYKVQTKSENYSGRFIKE